MLTDCLGFYAESAIFQQCNGFKCWTGVGILCTNWWLLSHPPSLVNILLNALNKVDFYQFHNLKTQGKHFKQLRLKSDQSWGALFMEIAKRFNQTCLLVFSLLFTLWYMFIVSLKYKIEIKIVYLSIFLNKKWWYINII